MFLSLETSNGAGAPEGRAQLGFVHQAGRPPRSSVWFCTASQPGQPAALGAVGAATSRCAGCWLAHSRCHDPGPPPLSLLRDPTCCQSARWHPLLGVQEGPLPQSAVATAHPPQGRQGAAQCYSSTYHVFKVFLSVTQGPLSCPAHSAAWAAAEGRTAGGQWVRPGTGMSAFSLNPHSAPSRFPLFHRPEGSERSVSGRGRLGSRTQDSRPGLPNS